jgi:succinate dehydrogenase/fumarate reductase cytochrome b subunit
MIRTLHRSTGLILALFIVSHLSVHLTALAGADAHLATLALVQNVYRNRIVEPLLIAAILMQIMAGITLGIRNWRGSKGDRWARLQLWSGFILAIFLLNHTGAALYTRYCAGLETNFWWASGTLTHKKARYWFYPYYALGVMAVFAHAAVAVRYRFDDTLKARLVLCSGASVTTAILLSFGGCVYAVPLKPEYRAYYDALLANFGL